MAKKNDDTFLILTGLLLGGYFLFKKKDTTAIAGWVDSGKVYSASKKIAEQIHIDLSKDYSELTRQEKLDVKNIMRVMGYSGSRELAKDIQEDFYSLMQRS